MTEPLLRLLKADPLALTTTLQEAYHAVRTFDDLTGPIGKGIDLLERHARSAAGGQGLTRDLIAARIVFHAQRYDLEAQLNQRIAFLYELQVQKSNLSAERHHARSQRFFYGMLAAQAGVVIFDARDGRPAAQPALVARRRRRCHRHRLRGLRLLVRLTRAAAGRSSADFRTQPATESGMQPLESDPRARRSRGDGLRAVPSVPFPNPRLATSAAAQIAARSPPRPGMASG